MADGAGTSSARRRRERRLRSWLKHERMTVAMELAAATHHSSPKGGWPDTTHDALRGQKTASSAGAHPGVLKEPEVLVGAVTVGYVAAPGPLLEVASMAGGDSVDGTALRFLVKKALDRQKEEERVKRNEEEKEERRMKRINEMLRLGLPVSLEEREAWTRWIATSSSSSSGKRRKRKKRRKRRTPRTSSLPGRARRRHRQWHVSLRHVVDVPVVRFSSNDEICADNYFYFWFKLNGKGRSEQWEVFLYCDKTIKVDRDSAEVLPWGVPLPDIGGVGFGSSPNFDTKHIIYELSLPSERGCVSLSCGGGFCSFDGAYDSVWDRVQPMTGKFAFSSFQYQEFVRCICMLNYWFSSTVEFYADNYNYSRFKLEDMCRCENWELYLYGVMTIKVDRDSVEVLPRGVPPPWFFTPLGNGSHIIHVLCLPSERGMGMSIFLAVPVSSGKYSGTSCRDVLHATLTGSTIDTTAAVGTTCTVSADCTVSAAPMCIAGACVACRVMVKVLPMVHTILFGVRCR